MLPTKNNQSPIAEIISSSPPVESIEEAPESSPETEHIDGVTPWSRIRRTPERKNKGKMPEFPISFALAIEPELSESPNVLDDNFFSPRPRVNKRKRDVSEYAYKWAENQGFDWAQPITQFGCSCEFVREEEENQLPKRARYTSPDKIAEAEQDGKEEEKEKEEPNLAENGEKEVKGGAKEKGCFEDKGDSEESTAEESDFYSSEWSRMSSGERFHWRFRGKGLPKGCRKEHFASKNRKEYPCLVKGTNNFYRADYVESELDKSPTPIDRKRRTNANGYRSPSPWGSDSEELVFSSKTTISYSPDNPGNGSRRQSRQVNRNSGFCAQLQPRFHWRQCCSCSEREHKQGRMAVSPQYYINRRGTTVQI